MRNGVGEEECHGEPQVVEEGHADEHFLGGEVPFHPQHEHGEGDEQDHFGRDEEYGQVHASQDGRPANLRHLFPIQK